MYVANSYIGKRYVPGEVIEDDLPGETLKWLLEAGAVFEVPDRAPKVVWPAGTGDRDTKADEVEAEETETDEAEAEGAETEAPEIDVADGIVQEDEKPGAGKQRGRRKAK